MLKLWIKKSTLCGKLDLLWRKNEVIHGIVDKNVNNYRPNPHRKIKELEFFEKSFLHIVNKISTS